MLSFHLVCGLFCCARALKFDSFSFTYFCFYFHYSRTWVIEDLFVIYFKKCSACVFLEDFCNSDLTFRFSIHFEFIFVCGARQCSNCIFCNTCSCQVSLTSILKRLSFLHCNFPHRSVGKESTCNAQDPSLIPGLGRSAEEWIGYPVQYSWAFLVAQLVKNLLHCGRPGFNPWVGKTPWRRDRLQATHSSILAWRIPGTV